MGLDTRKPVFGGLQTTKEQQRGRPVSASLQTDQHLCHSLIEIYNI